MVPIVPRSGACAALLRHSRRLLSTSPAASTSPINDHSSAASEIPSEIHTGGTPDVFSTARNASTPTPAAVVRPNGTSRRVFLLKPTLRPREIQGLAHRIDVLSRNDGINSIVIAADDPDGGDEDNDGNLESFNPTCLPSYAAREEVYGRGGRISSSRMTSVSRSALRSSHPESFPAPPAVSRGYDPTSVLAMGLHLDPATLERELMGPLEDLAKACRGNAGKVPVISMPHGKVYDSGYALVGAASYVLATNATSFQIQNPRRGLAFDPVGLSYLLPRLGWEFDQPAAHHSIGCALLLTLCGYEADGNDMVHTGLATHYVEDGYKLNVLETCLAEMDSHERQGVVPEPRRFHGAKEKGDDDVNEHFRNLAVANLVQNLSVYDAAGKHEYGASLSEAVLGKDGTLLDADPSLTLEENRIRLYGENTSWLVNWAATLKSAWEEPTVEGVAERLREVGATEAEFEGKEDAEEDLKVARKATQLAEEMDKASPLSMRVAHRLLLLGSQGGETMETCMAREKKSQIQLFTKKDGDYVRWAENELGGKGGAFAGWGHGSVKDVTDDEVLEIIGE